MKASELMIGDWVENDLREHLQVVELREEGALLSYNDLFPYDEIEPIPLTPEILEKNGFAYNDIPFVQGWEQFGLTLCLGGNGYRIGCGQNISMIINSVHELQHALRLCGIEKEIVL